jgi:hypothetical protein
MSRRPRPKLGLAARQIAREIGEPLTDEKLKAYFEERGQRGLPFDNTTARAATELAYAVPPRHRGPREES